MTKRKGKTEQIDVKELLARDEDFLQVALQALLQAALEAEMSETIGAEKGERTETRLAYRSGYYPRSLVTRVGTLELRVPQDRAGRFSTELFQRYQRSEKALVGTLAEMYVQGVSTRKVKAVTEALCGHSFSASAISAINKSLDEALLAFAERRLSEPLPYLILDARYEKVREAGIILSQAVLVAASPRHESCILGPVCASPSDTRGRSRVPELGSLGTVGGRRRGTAPDHRRRPRQPGEPFELAPFSLNAPGARPVRGRVCHLRRPSGPKAGDPRGPARRCLAALLRAFP